MSGSATIWHNPACGTSRNALAMIRAAGIEPVVVEYLKTPPSRDELARAVADAGLTPRQAALEKGTPFAELGLGDPGVTEDQILDAMLKHPVLINRPFVFTSRGVRLCRPSEVVLEILPEPLTGDFTKEDGEVVKGKSA
ncbi:arsenate reductase (glutaredoxin) [Hansschlegelia sp.]|uniref:arsenate reductase (glutaredoxin) n=1 Tax=Hansschlegelia sp. TaxID=2041892 RepID=UPI002D1A58F6|nr:arsenate reductase (glutaredoxin) [Hansschlegelia sp.]HVI28552.1 arsenate reductase (glutaredoxin) [Hansschlegelia sp.]